MSQTLPPPLYSTKYGAVHVGDSRDLLKALPDESIDLIVTSPPFALLRQKEYGNETQANYIDWLMDFLPGIKRVLKETGSFVLDLGGAYERGKPVRSLYNFRVAIRICDEFDLRLAEDFYWFNSSKLPSPIEWVNKRKIRAKDSVNTVWWFSKSDWPKADITKVRVPYSDRMKKLLKNADKYYKPKERPSGHDISDRFADDNGGALPSNLLQIPNSESSSKYLRICKELGISGHPARFPEKLPAFFIEMLTDPGDTVLDIFAGSCTTGHAAEGLKRNWIGFEISQPYAAASVFRFVENLNADEVSKLYYGLAAEDARPVELHSACNQPRLTLNLV